MAKAINYKDRISEQKEILKQFTVSSVESINEALKNITADEIIEDSFMKSDDPDVDYLIRQYEKQLILSKLNQQAFKSGLHTFFLTTNKYIKKHKLYNKFFKLLHFMHIVLNSKKVKHELFVAYQNLMIQQYSYFTGSSGTIVYGCTSDGKLLTTKEVMPGTTEISYQLQVNPKLDLQNIIKLHKKYGYTIKNPYDMHEISMTDQSNTNMVFALCYYINEITEGLKIEKYRNPNELQIMSKSLLNYFDVTDKLHEAIQTRNRMLPKQGVYTKIRNILNIEEVYLKELIKEDRVHLIFKIKFEDDSYTLGWCDINYKVYYDMWKYANLLILHERDRNLLINSTPSNYSKVLESTVLQAYANLVIDNIDKSLLRIQEVDSEQQLNTKILPSMYYEIRNEETIENKANHRTHFKKNDYMEIVKGVEPYTRKLPAGAHASEDAKAHAKALGIELSPGYTFVRSFDRAVKTVKK